MRSFGMTKALVRIGLVLLLAALGLVAMFDDSFEVVEKRQQQIVEQVKVLSQNARGGNDGQLF